MKLYSIRRWNELFENAQSRAVENCRWVAIPNRHDGENFSKIMSEKDGAIIFSAWILMVQIASKCTPRGTLVKHDGSPHSSLSLSLKTRAPSVWFEKGFDYLENHTDWLYVKEFTSEQQQTDRRLSGDCMATDSEGNGRNGMEGKEIHGLFDQFWAAYPKKRAKVAAVKAFSKNGCDKFMTGILKAIEVQKQSGQWRKNGGQFIPHPATWLNQQRWNDQMEVEIKTRGNAI